MMLTQARRLKKAGILLATTLLMQAEEGAPDAYYREQARGHWAFQAPVRKDAGKLAVARRTLMTYDPINDRKGGNIIKTNKVPVRPDCSGVPIELQCGLLLEGYRPGGIVRFYPASWKVVALLKEEQYFGRE